MRYLSLVFLVFTMWWTWSVIETPSALTEDTHVGIQEDLKRVITEYLQTNLTNVKDIQFEKFWTQTLEDNKVKASFSYSFEDAGEGDQPSDARIGIEGHAILNRQKAEDSEYDVWSLDELNVDSNKLTYKEGMIINSSEASK